MTNLIDRFIKASLLSAAASYIFFAINFLGQIVLARLLVPKDFGIFAFALAINEIVTIFLGFSTNQAFIHSPGKQADFNAGIKLNLIASTIFFMMALLGSWILYITNSATYAGVFFVIAIGQIFSLMGQIYLAPQEKRLHYKPVVLISGFSGTLSLIIAILFAFAYPSVWCLALRNLLMGLFLLIFALYFGEMKYITTMPISGMKTQFRFGIRTTIARALEVLLYRFPDIVIKKVLGISILGNFYQARYLAYFPIKFMQPFTQNVLFAFFSSHKEQREQLANNLHWVNYAIVRLLTPIAVLIYFFGKNVLVFIYGQKWALAGVYFQYFSLFILFVLLFDSISQLCYSLELQSYKSQAQIVAIIFFILGIFLMRHHSQYAALIFSCALVVGYFYIAIRLWFIKVRFQLLDIYFLPTLTVAISIFSYLYLNNKTIGLSVFLLLYTALLFVERKKSKQLIARIIRVLK